MNSPGSPHDTYLILRILDSILPYELQLDQLEKLIRIWDSIKYTAEICQSSLVTDADQRRECVPLARMIAFALQECGYQLRGIRNQTLGVLEDRGHSKHGVLTNVGMSVLETRTCGGKEGFDQLGFTELAQESQCVAADVFVGML